MKKLLSLMIVGTLACSMLAGCSSTPEELPKEGTVVGTQSTETSEVVNNETPSVDETVTAVLPEGTYVREVRDGFIKEIQSGDGKSVYKIAYGNAQVTGTESDLCITFSSMSNIGSWSDAAEDSGVWRYIDEGMWLTAVVWAAGYIPETPEQAITIDTTNIEDIKALLNAYTVYEDTLELRKADNYAAATVKVDRVDAGLSGYVTVIDDFETGLRWIVQFLMLSESADMDLLHETAKSLAIGTDFDRVSLSEEAKISAKPYTVSNDGTESVPESTEVVEGDATENTTENTTETVEQAEEPAETEVTE